MQDILYDDWTEWDTISKEFDELAMSILEEY